MSATEPPIELPFTPSESNRMKLHQFLLEYYGSSTFNTCDHQPLPLMTGQPMRLMVDPTAKPVVHHTPVPVPLQWQDGVKAWLDQVVRLGVLEPVPIGEPVTWCPRMVICAKRNGKSCHTVDFKPLNAHAKRETRHTPSPFHQARSVPIQMARRRPYKFVFGENVVEFAGFEITPDSVRPCMKYLLAILDFPVPMNITDVHSWVDLVSQVSYAFSLVEKMLPFRELLNPGIAFHWDENLNDVFEESKITIIHEIDNGVNIFDRSKPTGLPTDLSKAAIGFWLFQKHCDCQGTETFCCRTGWKITLIGCRFTHPAESRYAPVEGEALTVADSLDNARYFVLGCENLIVATDLKPLLKIMGDRSLEDISNTRLRDLKENTLRYRFRIIHIPGVKHAAADGVSRYPTGIPEKLTLAARCGVHQSTWDYSGTCPTT